MRLKAEALGLDAQDYTSDKVNIDELYTGVTETEVDPAQIDTFYQKKQLPMDPTIYLPNQFVILKTHD